MLAVLHASHDEFRSGWFVESLATQTLVVFLIRTRRSPFWRSRAEPALLITASVTNCATVGAIPLFSPVAHTPRLRGAACQLLLDPPNAASIAASTGLPITAGPARGRRRRRRQSILVAGAESPAKC